MKEIGKSEIYRVSQKRVILVEIAIRPLKLIENLKNFGYLGKFKLPNLS